MELYSIETEIEIVENGVIVTQTSDNGDVVAALQKHAGEVSASYVGSTKENYRCRTFT